MNQLVQSCRKVLSLVDIQFLSSPLLSSFCLASPGQTLHPSLSLHSTLCSFLFPLSNLCFPLPWFPLPRPQSAQNQLPPLRLSSPSTQFILIFWNVTTGCSVSVLLAGSPTLSCFYGIFSIKLHLWVFMCIYTWIRLREQITAVVLVKFPVNQRLAHWQVSRWVCLVGLFTSPSVCQPAAAAAKKKKNV